MRRFRHTLLHSHIALGLATAALIAGCSATPPTLPPDTPGTAQLFTTASPLPAMTETSEPTPTEASAPTVSPTSAPASDPSAPPERCRLEGQKTYMDPQNGFCFAYPERFSQGEFSPSQPGIFGPGVDSTGAAPTAYLAIEVKDAPAGSDLSKVIDDFLSELPAIRPTIEQYPFHLDDEQAMLLENVPGRLSSRRVLALHGSKLYNFTFSSSDLPQAQTDAAELFHMVTSSFVFLAREQGAQTSGGLAQWVDFKEGSFGLALPAGWTATLLPTPELPPGETPLGAQYELKPASYTGNSGSFVIVADATQISITQMVRRMCAGGCSGSPAPEVVTPSNGISATRYAFPIGLGMGKQQIDHEWYFIEQEGKLINHHGLTRGQHLLKELYGELPSDDGRNT